MKVNQQSAEKKLEGLISSTEWVYRSWINKKFEAMKLISTTEKGNLAENFFVDIIKLVGYTDVELKQGRRGDYDIRVYSNNKEIRIEVKSATQDTHNNFQFNGIRYDTNYTHLFCLGVAYHTIRYLIIPKEWLLPHAQKEKGIHLVSMTSRTSTTYKLTKALDKMSNFDGFEADIKQYI